ncbi:hypothetical protein Tco_1027734 [Tanacetum coccineum]
MVPPNKLGPDLNGKAVNEIQYRGMIGSLMYLTASRLDIQFSTCLCVRYQANPKESHLIVVKRIFRYLKGTPSLSLWYPSVQVPIFYDNTNAIEISNNPVLHSRKNILISDITLAEIIFLKGILNYTSFSININLLISSPSPWMSQLSKD